MAYCGLRPEEAFALSWRDVGRKLHVVRAFAAGELRDTTKTGRARAVELTDPVRDDVGAVRPRVHTDDELVFPNRVGHPLDLRAWRRRVRKTAARGAGVEATPYDLRHSFVSLQLHAGRSITWTAEQAGHSVRMLMDRYAHVVAEAEDAERMPLEEAIRAARGDRDVPRMFPVRVLRSGRVA